MRVAVIGAGIAGLAAGYRLTQAGFSCDVYERWPGLGGQVATLELGDGDPLERYYHHLFPSDVAIAELYSELGMANAIEWRRSSVGMFTANRLHPFTSALDLLRFDPIGLRSRLRMGLAVIDLQLRHPRVEPFEDKTARAWIRQRMGEEAWEGVWGPLLRGKFGDRANQVSMAWLWSKLTIRRQVKGKGAGRETLGYPRGGWQPLLDRLATEIEGGGGRVLIDCPAAVIDWEEGGNFLVSSGTADSFRRGHDPRRFPQREGQERYDAILATVPNEVFEQLLSEPLQHALAPGYLESLRMIEYHTALCVLLELDRPFSSFYWTNVADREVPFVGLIEHTNLVGTDRYRGRHYLYVANYVPAGDPLLNLDLAELMDRYEPGLRRVNREFSRSWVGRAWMFREPFAQPVVTVGYREKIPPHETGVPRLLLANTTQIYPEDRGTNYSVRLGSDVARRLVRELAAVGPSR